MKNITIVAGARPNFIKVAPLLRAIERDGHASYNFVYAGSAADATLEPSLFSDLDMPRPTTFLGVESSRLNEITSRVMAAFDEFLDSHPTDVVIVVDDLASTMAAAIVTKKRGLRLAHLVAGTRSFDMAMPKEVNRLVIDALSDYLFTAGVRNNSIATREQANTADEGQKAQGGTFMVGNILMDSLRYCRSRFTQPAVLDAAAGSYIVFTLNRKALIDDEQKLAALLQAIAEGADGHDIIAPLRPKAAEAVKRLCPQVKVVEPMGYLEFGWLTANALGIITDSGNVAEEATFNGVPCITLNSYTEHQETVTRGTNVLVGESPEKLLEEMRRMTSRQWKASALPDRWDGRTAERIVQILVAG